MSDADSESEYSDYTKTKSILEKSLLPTTATTTKYSDSKLVHRRRSKNKFQDIHRRKKCICIGALLFVILSLIVLFINIFYQNDNNSNQKSILILNWHSDVWNGAGPTPVSNAKCKFVTTPTTTPQMSTREVSSYDVIILNSTAENVLLGIDAINSYSSNQLRIFATQRPLQFHNTVWLQELFIKKFHKSLTYSLKSDFQWHPYKIVRKNDSKIIAPSLQPQWIWNTAELENFQNNHTRDLFLAEVKEPSPAALSILRRPCMRPRKEMLQQIEENMDVHTYGECGSHDSTSSCIDDCLFLPSNRESIRYKFYLAFEEELCVDYVGENFFKALDARLVPVVFGGANYTRFAPPSSYINARDFASVRELTDYLLHLDQNPEEHIKYFIWQETYEVQRNELNFEEICDYFESEGSRKINKDLEAYGPIVDWLKENKCEEYEMPKAWQP